MTENNKWINNKEDVEISLKDLFYYLLKQWRPIMLFAIAVALLAGGCSVVKNKSNVVSDEAIEKYQEAINSYDIKLESALKQKEKAESLLKTQTDRLDNAAVMQFNLEDAVYAEYEYELEFEKNKISAGTTQEVNEKYNKLIEKYIILIREKLLQTVADDLSMDKNDLNDIIVVRGDSVGHRFFIGVYDSSYDGARSILNTYDSYISQIEEIIEATFEAHSVRLSGELTKDNVNQNILNIQLSYLNNVTAARNAYDEAAKAINDMEAAKPVEPTVQSSGLKDFIKLFLIGGIAAGFVAVAYVCMLYLMGGKLKSEEQFNELFNVKSLAVVGKKSNKSCPLSAVDRFIAHMFSVGNRLRDDEALNFAAANIANALSIESVTADSEIIFTGSISEEEIKTVAGYVKDKLGLGNALIYGELRNSYEAVEKLPKAAAVILVEKTGQSTSKDIESELILLNANAAKLLGVVIIDND